MCKAARLFRALLFLYLGDLSPPSPSLTITIGADVELRGLQAFGANSLVVVGSEIGRLAELAHSPNSYLTPSLTFHTPLLGGVLGG